MNNEDPEDLNRLSTSLRRNAIITALLAVVFVAFVVILIIANPADIWPFFIPLVFIILIAVALSIRRHRLLRMLRNPKK